MSQMQNKKASLFSNFTSIPEALNVNYLPSLDGFRGISIIIVVLAHQGVFINFGIHDYFYGGVLGVYIFFVISGFLITTLLIKEQLNNGRISLKKFYIRRFFRIIPVAYLYLATLYFLNWRLSLNMYDQAFIGSALFVGNIPRVRYLSWYMAHYWSLSVEEQYYMFFPTLLKNKLKYLIAVIPILLLLILSICFLENNYVQKKDTIVHDIMIIVTQIDGVLIGSLFALLRFKNLLPMDIIKKYKIGLNIFVFIALLFLFHLISAEDYDLVFFKDKLITILSSCLIGLLIVSNIERSNDIIFKFLNNKFLKKIGVLSYSIYIWQQILPLIEIELFAIFKFKSNIFYNLIIIYLISYLSYNLFEKFFLKIKNRFQVSK